MRAQFLNGLDGNRGILGLETHGFFSGFEEERDLSWVALLVHPA